MQSTSYRRQRRGSKGLCWSCDEWERRGGGRMHGRMVSMCDCVMGVARDRPAGLEGRRARVGRFLPPINAYYLVD